MRRVDSRTVRLVLSLGVVLGIGAIPTSAAWTDSVPVTGTTMGTARVDLTVAGLDSVSNYSSANTSTMAPSGSTAGVIPVTNSGTVPLYYHLDATGTNPDGKGLASALAVKVTGASSVTGSLPNATCGGATLPNSGTTIGANLVGSAASPLVLAPSATDYLCIQVGLPANAPTSIQAATTAASFTLLAVTNPTTSWSDSVTISGLVVGTATISAPTLTCGVANATHVVLNWTSPPGATSYRVHSGSGGSNVKDVPSTTTAEDIQTVSSGTIWVQAIYGNTTWLSADSNTRNYNYTGTSSSTCS